MEQTQTVLFILASLLWFEYIAETQERVTKLTCNKITEPALSQNLAPGPSHTDSGSRPAVPTSTSQGSKLNLLITRGWKGQTTLELPQLWEKEHSHSSTNDTFVKPSWIPYKKYLLLSLDSSVTLFPLYIFVCLCVCPTFKQKKKNYYSLLWYFPPLNVCSLN